jgi:hypothetical protein
MPEDKAIPQVETIKRRMTGFSIRVDPVSGVKSGFINFDLITRYADGRVEIKPSGHIQLDEAKLATIITPKLFGDLKTFAQAEADLNGL